MFTLGLCRKSEKRVPFLGLASSFVSPANFLFWDLDFYFPYIISLLSFWGGVMARCPGQSSCAIISPWTWSSNAASHQASVGLCLAGSPAGGSLFSWVSQNPMPPHEQKLENVSVSPTGPGERDGLGQRSSGLPLSLCPIQVHGWLSPWAI